MAPSSGGGDEKPLLMATEEFASVLETLLDQVRRHATHEYARAMPNPYPSNPSTPETPSNPATPETTDQTTGEPMTEPLSWRSANNGVCSEISIMKRTTPDGRCHANGRGTHKAEDAPTPRKLLTSTSWQLGQPGVPTCPPRLVRRKSFFRDTVDMQCKNKRQMNMKDALKSDFNVQTSRWVTSPETNRFVQHWNLVAAVAMAYVAVLSPVQVAMMEVQMDFFFVMNCLVDLVFILDMILQFFMMYSVKTSVGNRLESRHSVIVMNYLRTWFFIDLFAVLPFDLVALLLQSKAMQTAKTMKFLRLLRLLKMTKMMKASRITKRLETQLVISYEGLALNKFFLVLLLISHWLSCAWALTLKLTEHEGIPQWVDSVQDQEENVEIPTKDSVWKLYMASLYFIAYTITSVGYGDITPKNILERVVCILILFFSGITWACVIGQVASIVGNMDANDQEFRRLMDNLNCMVRDRGLPQTVSRRLRKFFLSARQAQKNEQEEQIIQRMSHVLQSEVAVMSNWHWVRQMRFMNHILPDADLTDVKNAPVFVADIALSLNSATFAQSEVFGKPRVLYVLRKGLAITRVGGWFHIESTGSVWGEDFVLSDSRLRDPDVRLALTYVEVFFLEYQAFMNVVDRHSSSNPALAKQIRSFTAQLSARRAILTEARWRRVFEQQKPQLVQEKSNHSLTGRRSAISLSMSGKSNHSLTGRRSASSFSLSGRRGVSSHSLSATLSVSSGMGVEPPKKSGDSGDLLTPNRVNASEITSMFRCDP